MLENIAIILAAGAGKRFIDSLPKQYHIINNKPVIYYSLLTFLQHSLIHKVLPVINKEYEDTFISILNKYQLSNNSKMLPYVFGGETRQNSVFNALKYIEKIAKKNKQNIINKVLIHDSARPFVSSTLIDNVLYCTTKNQGCIPVLKINDSLKKIGANNYVVDSINRDTTVKAQTPQGFPFVSLLNSYKHNLASNVNDDAEIIAKSNLKIAIIKGSLLNEKITTKEHLHYLEKLTSSIEYRSGQGFDVHAFAIENVDLYLGGIKIPDHKGLLGHSDADVVLHALVDAILGALSKGDIGDYFPPSDNKWKGAASSIFLIKAKELLQESFATIVNVDITIICETPKITNYKKLMISNIANILNINTSIINIKATTTEKLGFIGRKEGIAAMANVLVLLKNTNITQ